jgi:hypothetical protein
MPLPVIAGGVALAGKVLAGTAGRAIAGQAVKTVAGQAAKTTAQQAAKKGIGRTASGKTLQAAKPKSQWDWKDMASNFEELEVRS